jgi:O-glycosyl hydrolase
MPVTAGHSYFTDKGDTAIITVRSRLRDTATKYGISFWQSEYSMLADGYREGKKGRIPAIDCALFLAKIIYHDLAVANATAWQFWNAWEPGRSDNDVRYCLLALNTNADNAAGDFAVTKNLWALGHYSRFIRPGMKRIIINRNDSLNHFMAAQDVMLSAFANKKDLVMVAVNYASGEKEIALQISGADKLKNIKQYITTAREEDNMRPEPMNTLKGIRLKPRSITTFVMER